MKIAVQNIAIIVGVIIVWEVVKCAVRSVLPAVQKWIKWSIRKGAVKMYEVCVTKPATKPHHYTTADMFHELELVPEAPLGQPVLPEEASVLEDTDWGSGYTSRR